MNTHSLLDSPLYLVTGHVLAEAMHFCRDARKYEDKHLCGKAARLFEPKDAV
jgi:hypothetical protein